MKKEVSEKQLIIIALVAIVLSIFSIFFSIGKLGITGALTTSGTGYVNVTVPAAAGIELYINEINFTNTQPGDTKTSYESDDVSTRGEGGTHLPCGTDNHCGMNISNTGSTFINITLYESSTDTMFSSGTYDKDKHFLYNVTMQDPDYAKDVTYGGKDNCSVGYDGGLAGVGGVGYWRGVPSSAEVAVCYLNYSDTLGGATTESSDTRPDVARIEFNITVPNDEGSGDKGAAIIFTASDATG